MEFVEIARFPTRLEAETIGHALDQYDIPFLVRSPDLGMFGYGHQGPTPMGAALCVPEDRAEEVTELLSCVAKLPDDEETEDDAGEDED
jgi:hypothetical protein